MKTWLKSQTKITNHNELGEVFSRLPLLLALVSSLINGPEDKGCKQINRILMAFVVGTKFRGTVNN